MITKQMISRLQANTLIGKCPQKIEYPTDPKEQKELLNMTNESGLEFEQKQQSRVIFNGYGYTATISGYSMIDGPFLCVTRDQYGKAISGQAAVEWCDCIETAIDDIEKRDLCRAIYNA